MSEGTDGPVQASSWLEPRTIGTYVLAGALQRGVPILALPLVTRVLTADEFGEVAVAASVATLGSALFSLGINAAIVRLYHEEGRDGPTRWAALVRVQLLASAVLALGLLATGPAWGRLVLSSGWGGSLQLSVILAAALSWNGVALGLLRASERAPAFALNGGVQALVGVGLGVALAAQIGPAGYVGGLAAGASIAAAIGLAQTWRKPVWDASEVKSGLKLAWPFLIHRVSVWALALSDRVVIEHLVGTAAAGRYNSGYVVAGALLVVVDSAQSAWAPRYFASADSAKERTLPMIVGLGDAFGLVSSGLIVLTAPLLVTLVAPGSYDVPQALLALVSGAVLPQVAYFVWMAVLLDHKQTGAVAIASSAAAAVNVALNLVLTPSWGIEAAAAATAVAYGVQAAIVGAFANRLVAQPVMTARRAAAWAAWATAMAAAAALGGGAGHAVRFGSLALACGVAFRVTARARLGRAGSPV